MRSLARLLLGRWAAARILGRFLPGGWLVFVLGSPRARGFMLRRLRSLGGRRRSRL